MALRWRLLALAGLVLAGHAWLLTGLAPPPAPGKTGQGLPRALGHLPEGRVAPVWTVLAGRVVVARPAPPVAPGAAEAIAPPRSMEAAAPAGAGPQLAPVAQRGPGPRPVETRPPPTRTGDGPTAVALAQVAEAGPERPAVPETGSATAAAPDDTADPPTSPAAEAAAGQPPPVYPTQPPAAAQLRYRLHYHGQDGQAELRWQPDGARYQLQLTGRSAAGAPLIEQLSEGGFDAAGLAPERFADRRRGRGGRAANFRREQGLIGFSGPAWHLPIWPGVQDRLSWLVQWLAIQAAASAGAKPAPGEISLAVVDARGGASLWRLQDQGEEALATPWGAVATRRWQHLPAQPERADAQRVELWVASAGGAWPLQIRLTQLRSGSRLELQLLAPPP